MAKKSRAREDRSLTLEEAKALYVPRSSSSRPLDNHRIKSHLRRELRRRAELAMGMDWQEIERYHRAHFELSGHPQSGTATIELRGARGCGGGWSTVILRLRLSQSELFKDDRDFAEKRAREILQDLSIEGDAERMVEILGERYKRNAHNLYPRVVLELAANLKAGEARRAARKTEGV